jgi:peptide-methionine (S)-S-oxide reductase
MSTSNRSMLRYLLIGFSIVSLGLAAFAYSGINLFRSSDTVAYRPSASAINVVDPAIDLPKSSVKKSQTLVIGGGCFWGVEGVFEKLKGVSAVVSGFSGGNGETAHYEVVATGLTGHAEVVEITYDPEQVSYGQLLKVFFAIAHDPTQLDRQGPDSGPQYRSAIFFNNPDEQRVAKAYIEQLNQSKVFAAPIVTQLAPLDRFYEAEGYHQNFIQRNPRYPYVVVHDLPKLAQLKQQFPNLLKSES